MTDAQAVSREGLAQPVKDALIIGAGVAGIHQLQTLRQRGWDVQVVEAGSGVGGTWYWNRYPGARVDSESYTYGYFFDKDLLQEWDWTEHFSSQPDNERYLNHVADRFGLRDFITFDTKVVSARFLSAENVWSVQLSDDSEVRTRFLITAIGILSAPQYPRAPGRERFTGLSFHTARWPHEEIDLKGKRVAVVGTGSSGVQLITAIAKEVGELTVFQRTPNWGTPLNNSAISADDLAAIKGSYDEIWASCQNAAGFVHQFSLESAFDKSPEDRRAFYETLWNSRGFSKAYGNYVELIATKEINTEFSDFLAEKIRARIDDPRVAEKLIPTDHGFGMKRPPFESGYYEVYNQPNVELVDLSETPIEEITETGIRTSDKEYEFDVIVYATGFDAVTGSFNDIEIVGEGGRTLAEYWADGPRSFVGTASHGFPNLLYVGGPQSLGGNIPRAVEKQVDFVTALLDFARANGIERIEATEEAEQGWVDHVEETVSATIFAEGNSWFFGSNTPGKKRAFGLYVGGLTTYSARLAEITANEFEGFEKNALAEKADLEGSLV